MKNPYLVPPFEPAHKSEPPETYFWWSWHPCYPYWSKSCWGGTSVTQAWEVFRSPRASDLSLYHNKLIRESPDGSLTEVADVPCGRLEVWQEIARDPHGWRRPTDAQPIEGWDDEKPLTN